MTAGAFLIPSLAQQGVTQPSDSSQGNVPQSDRVKTLPYPLQLLPGQTDSCIVLDRYDNEGSNSNLTPQEIHAIENWNDLERYVWQQACKNEVAQAGQQPTETAENSEETDNKKSRVLGNNFLNTILAREPFQSALPGQLYIKDAEFEESVNLSAATIEHELRLENSTFKENLNFAKADFSKGLYLDNSTFKKELFVNEARIDGNLFLRNIFLEEGSKVNLEKIQARSVVLSGEFGKNEIDLSGAKTDVFFELPNDTKKELAKNIEKRSSLFTKLNENSDNFEIGKTTINLSSQSSQSATKKKDKEKEARVLFGANNEGEIKLETNDGTRKFHYLTVNTINTIKDFLFGSTNLRQVGGIRINLSNAQLGNFNIVYKNRDLGGVDTSSLDEITEEDYQHEDYKCRLNLSGLRYEKLNAAAFTLIKSCLISQYYEILSEDSNAQQASELLQPFRQIATVSRSLGRYQDEREFLYKQKRLEMRLEKLNHNWLNVIQLRLQDWVYGFGYRRSRTLRLFGIFWVLGFLLTYRFIVNRHYEDFEKDVNKGEKLNGFLTPKKKIIMRCQDLTHLETYVGVASKIFFRLTHKNNERIDVDVFLRLSGDAESFNSHIQFWKQASTTLSIQAGTLKDDENLKLLAGFVKSMRSQSEKIAVVGCLQDVLAYSDICIFPINLYQRHAQYLYLDLNNITEKSSLINYHESAGINGYFHKIWKEELFRRILMISLIFSIDNLLPVVDIEKKYQDFVFNHSEGGTRLFFAFQRVIALIFASILLPIFLIGG
jgi:hypothetical protein